MSDLEIRSEVVIDAAIEVVWDALTQPDQITRWLADRAELQLEPGGPGRLAFRDEEGRTAHIVPLVVEAVEAPQLFSFRWCHP
ncbi:MAG TPA: SRPBCC domain-containing protein, partial [Acidimicrobiales bacterium]|nr:SRPBCC domain-containing protein [Acidimicrobiales bacterium]